MVDVESQEKKRKCFVQEEGHLSGDNLTSLSFLLLHFPPPCFRFWNLPRVGWLWKASFWRTSHSTDATAHSSVGGSMWKKIAQTQKSKLLLKRIIIFKLENNLMFLNNLHHPPAFAQLFVCFSLTQEYFVMLQVT